MNAAEKLGRHLCGFPTKTLKGILSERNILKRFRQEGLRCAYVNAYQPGFFLRLGSLPESAMTYSALVADQALFRLDQILKEEALYQDFTNQMLIERGYDVPLYSPAQAGRILAKISSNYHLAVYEYFITDFVGHAQDARKGFQEVSKLDEFLVSLLEVVDLR